MFQLRTIFALLMLVIFLRNVFGAERTTIKKEDRCFQYQASEYGESMYRISLNKVRGH